MDKNKFKEILTIIDSNKLGHKNKIGDFKYIDIKDLVNNIKDNTISEIGWLAHLVSRFACNTRMIVDASSSPLVSHVK